MSLRTYNRKRKFNQTPEPKGKDKVKKGRGPLRFVVQMHDASRLHFDLRLEFEGVFKSWAVPKGPSLNPLDQRLAVFVEDHPLEYGSFEGIIPSGNYGAGTVMIWDEGTYLERGSKSRNDSEAAIVKGFKKGHMTFLLDGHKLRGEFALIKLKKDASDKAWLLVKKRDEFATYKRTEKPDNTSVTTGRTIEEIAEEAEQQGKVWLSKRNKKSLKPAPPKKADPKKSTVSKDPMPRKNKPMLPSAANHSTFDKDWLVEPHAEGLRAIAEVEGRKINLYSRSGLRFDGKFPQIIADLKDQKHLMVLDGEIVKAKSPAYYVFDLLFVDGRDLRKTPLKERKKILKDVLSESTYVKHIDNLKKSAGSIAKKSSSLYHPGVSKDWIEVHKPKAKSTRTSSLEEPQLTNLDKVFFPDDKITKGDLIEYYRSISSYILPYLIDRPESLNRHPNGIKQKGFFQKDMVGHLPRWIKTHRIFSESADKTVQYMLCQDERSLLYMANLGCIEINPWLSRVGQLDKPDYMVIDLDPDGNDFKHVIEVAEAVHEVLDSIGAANFIKTSGATGLHIGVPLGARYEYDRVRDFAESICRVIAKKFPATTSVERKPERRRKKIYLDFMQNRRGQTLAAPFSVRPRAGAPVSMPLRWEDLGPRIKPERFNIDNALSHVQKFGDSWKPILGSSINLEKCARALKKNYGTD